MSKPFEFLESLEVLEDGDDLHRAQVARGPWQGHAQGRAFGASELSDISGFVELPDGKARHGRWGWAMKGAASSCVEVIGSGGSMRKHHAYGKLLLWEGVFVKVELMRAKEGVTQAEAGTSIAGSPHNGNIEVILIDKENGMVISGGDDGHLRWWPIEEIDTAEADYDNGILEFGIRMRKEVRVPPSAWRRL
ncbi:unnamed protein product [Durusdinium trenchii]|uniref:Uncharacterized protein n=1 Tax=Durusdinium trenchii TaxID=1381693 RepID=A0ABP0QGH0_9DINO